MRKYLFILIFAVLLAPCVWAQSFKRTAKMPGFFIPKGALQTGNKPEKLVPVEQMRYKGQLAPAVIEAKRQAQEEARLKAEENERLEKQRLQKEATRAREEQERLAKKQAEKDKISSELKIAKLKEDKIKAEQQKLQEQKAEEEKFAQIIEEYRKDIRDISDNKPTPNKRLMEMIADYKDLEHPI